jgi:hypothetical protein
VDFFDKKVALRSAPHLSAFSGQFDARYAIGILVHAHVTPRMIELCFAAAAAKICDAFFNKLRQLRCISAAAFWHRGKIFSKKM